MKLRLLVLTAGFGEGHNAAARALVAACEAAHGPGSARLVDAFALVAPRLNHFVRRGYIELINRVPTVWSTAYQWMDRSTRLPGLLRASLRAETRLIARLIAAEAPEVICNTYPAYGFLLERLVNEGANLPPFFNVVTDSISINSLWWRPACTGWVLPNEDTAEVMRRAGVDPTRLQVCGFPVAPFFAANAGRLVPPDLAELPPVFNTPVAPRVLYIVNSGTRDALATARLLLAQPEWEITCAVGRDTALLNALVPLTKDRKRFAQILGWTDQIPKLLMTHHVVISKAGGATTQEAIAARCPMIVNQIVPGQEEGNYELLRRHGVGALAETPDAVITELYRAFNERGRVWRRWREALAPLARPDAARATIAHVLPPPAEPVPIPLRTPVPAHA